MTRRRRSSPRSASAVGVCVFANYVLNCFRLTDHESKAIDKLMDRLTGKDREKKVDTRKLYDDAVAALQKAYSSVNIKVGSLFSAPASHGVCCRVL